MQTEKIVVTLATCTLYHFPYEGLTHLQVQVTSPMGELLIQKQVQAVSRQGEVRIGLGFKITSEPDDKDIVISISSEKLPQLGTFEVDLQILQSTRTQSYKLSDRIIAKISIENEQMKSTLTRFKMGKKQDNQQFIRERQMFLESLKIIKEQENRSMMRTPEFTRESLRESPPKDRDDLNEKIQELLVKTRQLKQERIDYEECEVADNCFSGYFEKKKAFRKAKFPRLMHAFEQLEQQEIEYLPHRVIHEHYHTTGEFRSPSPYTKLHKTLDIQGLVCRTNDSESVSSQEEPVISPRQYFNARMPFKYRKH